MVYMIYYLGAQTHVMKRTIAARTNGIRPSKGATL